MVFHRLVCIGRAISDPKRDHSWMRHYFDKCLKFLAMGRSIEWDVGRPPLYRGQQASLPDVD